MWAFLRPDAKEVLKDRKARRSLARYFAVLENDKVAKFLIARRLAASFSEDSSTSDLWRSHNQLLQKFCETESRIDHRLTSFEKLTVHIQSFFDLKAEIARRVSSNCHFCTRHCSVNRADGELGFCKCGNEITVSSMFEHMGEEPELVPSGTIFTLGCTMRCLHCQNWAISQWMEPGEIYSLPDLANAIEHLRRRGCRNANLVGGDPTPWLAQWLETFKYVSINVPVVWNSNSYYSRETAELLAGFVDVYLLDFKYGNNECAQRVSNAPGYWEACTRNHRYGKKYGELIIRVLVLPGHLECCTERILRWISANLGPATRTNLMFQYRPEWRAGEIPELRRRLTPAEMDKALQLAKDAGLTNFIT